MLLKEHKRALQKKNISGYQCAPTAAHSGFHVVYFLSLSFLLGVLPTDPSPSPPCHPMCEAHMVQWNCCLREHASACPDFIRGIKEWDGGKNPNKMMIAGPWLFSLFYPAPHTPPPCSVLSRVEHQMTEKALLLGRNGLQGKVARSVSCIGFIWFWQGLTTKENQIIDSAVLSSIQLLKFT